MNNNSPKVDIEMSLPYISIKDAIKGFEDVGGAPLFRETISPYEIMDKNGFEMIPGEVYIIASDPFFKRLATFAFILGTVRNLSIMREIPIALFSGNNSCNARFLNQVLLGIEGHFPERTTYLQDVEELRKKEMEDIPFYLSLSSDLSLDFIKNTSEKLVRKEGVQYIFIDDFDYLLYSGLRREDKEYTSEIICYALKALANELNIPIVILSETVRDINDIDRENMKPELSNLEYNKQIRKFVDKIFLMYRPEYFGMFKDCAGNDMRAKTVIDVCKCKYGNIGEFVLKNEPGYYLSDDSLPF